jgi:hypothetical protein
LLAVKEVARATAASCSSAISSQTAFANGCDGFRQIPKFEKLGSKIAIVIGPLKRTEFRLTAPRGGGQKHGQYEIPLWIHAAVKDEFAGGDDFDVVLEIIQAAFRTTNVPVVITDPSTGAVSQLLKIGEEMHLQQDEPGHMASGPAGLVHFFADLTVTAIEIVQG